jgi:hypothetical protein
VIAGLGLAVGAAALDRPALGLVGVLVAGAPGLYHAMRSAVLENDLRRLGAARRAGPTTPVAGSAVVPRPEPEAQPPTASSDRFGLVDARIDTAELQAIWDLGDGPDTGPVPVVTVAEPRVLVELPASASGAIAAPAPSATMTLTRPRAGTIEARIYDALAMAEADELTRALELPSSRGRHAADAPFDAPSLSPRADRADSRVALVTAPRRGRRAA